MKTGKHTRLGMALGLIAILGTAWAINSPLLAQETEPASVETRDFDPNNPSDYPLTTEIDVTITGIGDFGVIEMLEGIDNESLVSSSDGSIEIGETRYSRLVMHGVFSRQMRDWREEIIAGDVVERDIELELRNEGGRRVLTIEFLDCVPVRFTLPPLATDGSTRYLERMEFVYDEFEIRD